MFKSLLISLIFLFSFFATVANEVTSKSENQSDVSSTKTIEVKDNKENLKALSEKISDLTNGVKYLEKEVKKTSDPELKKEQAELLKKKKEELSVFREIFSENASKIVFDYKDQLVAPERKNLSEEIQDILSPIFESFRSASEIPKKIQSLKYELPIYEKQLIEIQNGEKKVNKLLKETKHRSTKAELLRTKVEITKKKKEVQILRDSAIGLLKELENKQEGIWKKSTRIFTQFVGTKGKHFLAAIASSGLILIVLLFIRSRVFDLEFVNRNLKQWRTPVQFIFMILSIMLSLLSGLFVLYLLNDIVLLTIFLLVIGGVVWSLKSLGPVLVKELRLALNLGSVKEGHLIVWKGVPWLVQKIGFVPELINPSLSGGRVKVLVRELFDLHSRPVVAGEAWFPSKPGDWVELSDSSFGKVVQQTPENVVIEGLGRQKKYYQTAHFLSLHPINLSQGFRIEISVGFDYDIQKNITQQFKDDFEAYYKEALSSYEKQIRSLNLFFETAGAHSLNFLVALDCDGSLAPFKKQLEMKISEVYLNFCNERRLGIPFHQLRLHQS